MIRIVHPLQILPHSIVLEQQSEFRLILSSSLAIDLGNNKSVLTIDSIKKTIEHMGDKLAFDMGMPKPKAEVLVSGSFHSPNNKPIPAGEVKISVGNQSKELIVFGPRKWSGGLPTAPEPISCLPLSYKFAFGGANFPDNPEGIGFNDGLLPQIETSGNLIDSPRSQTLPAGLSPLDPFTPRRARYLGTYDDQYMKTYFPGYPADMDWRAFMCAPEDQWQDEYFTGEEDYELHNMHPDNSLISGTLPGLYSRAFIQYRRNGENAVDLNFKEIPLHLDTIWFFPEANIALLISRGGIEVQDDEASEISHIMHAYERRSDPKRDHDYYRAAFNRRIQSDDRLLDNLNTQDLIAEGDKCAMELFQLMGQSDDTSSPLADNMDAKVKGVQEMVDTEVNKATSILEEQMAKSELPEDQKPDLKALLDPKAQASNPEVDELKKKMEEILPGVTSGNPKDLKLKDFSFDKLGALMSLTTEFTDKKQKEAMEMAKPELEKAIQNLKEQLDKNAATLTDPQKNDILASIQSLEDTMTGATPKAPLPRVNAEELIAEVQKFSPDLSQQIQQLEKMKTMQADPEAIEKASQQIQDLIKEENNAVHEQIRNAEKSFKEGYIMGAHFMEPGLSPHKEPIDEVKNVFLTKLRNGESLAEGDWACIDLSGQSLDGVDLSGAYLEQVDFTGASLKNAKLSGAILSRAILDMCDLTGANLTKANIGAVHAHQANFTDANMDSADLSKGDFTQSTFTNTVMTNLTSLEICVDKASFQGADMSGMTFLEITINGTKFDGANLTKAVFISTSFIDVSLNKATPIKCTFVDTPMSDTSFDYADVSGSCFVQTEEGKSSFDGVSFAHSNLSKSNLQGMSLKKANLSGATMESASFMDADLSDADLSMAHAKGATFRKAILKRANLNRIDLPEGSLSKANMVGASFIDANLFGTDFLRSTISETDFSGANLDTTLIQDWRPS